MFIANYERNGRMLVPQMHNIGSSLGIGQVALVKQLRGENNYLKDQIDASFYRYWGFWLSFK